MKIFLKYKINIYKALGFVCIVFLISINAIAQTSKNLPYIYQEKLEKANEYYNLLNYKRAINLYLTILRKASKDTAIIYKIANSFRLLNDSKNAEEWYRQAITVSGNNINASNKLYFAQVLTINGKYDEALHWFKDYYTTAPASDLRAKEAVKSLENISSFYFDTTFYVAYPVNINTKYAEFGACFYKNGIIFLSDRNLPKSGFLLRYFSIVDSAGNLSEPVQFITGIKSEYNEGPVSFYNNYKNMIFSQNSSSAIINKKRISEIPLQLFQAHQNSDNRWVTDTILPFINQKYSFTQPSVSSDGKTIYFSSNMPGGYGGTDIYMSKLQDTKWSAPINLGTKINTPGDEMFPYIFKDSILYFSSNGHGGLGGLDIFKIDVNGNGQLETFGVPVNSPNDDFGIILNKDGLSGYFASNRANGAGADDIYRFKLIRKALYVKIIDDKTMLAVSKAEIFTGDTLHVKRIGITDQDGNCTLVVPICNSFQIRIKKEDYESKQYAFESVNSSQDKLAVISLKIEIKLAAIPQNTDSLENESIKNTLEAVNSFQDNIAVITKKTENESTENIKKTENKLPVIPYKAEIKHKEDKVIITDENNNPIHNPKNVIYKVQIWASRSPANEAELKLKYKGDLKINYFYDDRWYKYSIGEFSTYTEAKQCLYSSMVNDAFILAYMNNKRVQITIAKAATNETEVEKPVRRYYMTKP